MPILTPSYVFSFESRMRVITENAFSKRMGELWWPKVGKLATSTAQTEHAVWTVETASIEELLDGETSYADVSAFLHSYDHAFAGKSLQLGRSQFEDVDGNGINAATSWSEQIGAWSAYWPQHLMAKRINAGATSAVPAYDGANMFSTLHPINPLDASGTKYSNLLAQPLNTATVEDAIGNLFDALSAIHNIPTPNGLAPRLLKATHLLYPSAMKQRILTITGAEFIAGSAASGGGGSVDIKALQSASKVEPIECEELGAAYGGSDTNCFLVCADVVTGPLGAMIYSVREPFMTTYHSDMSEAELRRTRKLEWHCQGRNTVVPGHPFGIFQLTGA